MSTTSLSFRVALLALAGLAAGCAHGRAAAPRPSRDGDVTAADIERAPGQPIETLLMARVPGLLAIRTEDGGIALRIRGTSTLAGDGDPLYVIDGMPVLPGPNGKLSGLNPYEIQSVSVLKDAAATAMYGLRATYGAIVVKTKRGDSER